MANFYTDNKDLQFHLNHPLMKKIVNLKENGFEDKNNFDYAPLDFEDAMDSYEKVLEVVGEICGEIIAPNAEDVDANGPQLINNEVIYAEGTKMNLDAVNKANLMGITLPRRFGGLNFPIVPYIMAADMVSRADASFVNIWGLQDCAETINEFADEEQKEKYLPRICNGETAAMDLTEPDAGSDLQAVQLKAHYDELKKTWFLNGVKRFITNGDGHISLVLARSEEGTKDGRGLSMFIYDRNNKAVTIRRIEHKMGIIGSPTCELVFKDAPAELCGSRRMGLIKYVMSLMNGARLGIGAQSVGICEAAYREALKYAQEREQFSKAIIKFPAVYEIITNMKLKTQAGRTLLYETSRFVDVYKAYSHIGDIRPLTPEEKTEAKEYQKLADAFTPVLKLITSEYCNKLAYDAVQIHGGTGFMKDFAVERIYRDARITSIYEGTSQLQVVAAIRGVITGTLLKQIRAYEGQIGHEFENAKNELMELTSKFEKAFVLVTEKNNSEFLEFHARRLVELAANIVMSYLLILDAQRDSEYKDSALLFLKLIKSENKDKFEYIANSTIADLDIYSKI